MRIVIKAIRGVAKATFVYDDAVHAAIGRLGQVTITRASDVEYEHEAGGWIATIDPNVWLQEAHRLAAVRLGPYASREDALFYEKRWIEQTLGKRAETCSRISL